MKQIILFLIVWFNFPILVNSQNLLPNGSFEDTVSCPNSTGDIQECLYWIRATAGTSEYFHPCSGATGVPNNPYGNQLAQDGIAYAGLYLGSPNNNREYIESPFSDTLTADSCYHFEMYVSLANTNYTTDNIQVYFSDNYYQNLSYFGPITMFTPQIINPPGNFFDTLNWTLVSGDYIAHGGESYLIIGNYLSNTMTNLDTIYNVFDPQFAAYVYIDNVSLIPNVCTSVDEINDLPGISINPNPAVNFVTFTANFPDNYQLVFYNSIYQEVFKKNVTQNSIVNVELFPSGLYFYYIKNSKGRMKTGKLLKM